jgi:hypothetical protein
MSKNTIVNKISNNRATLIISALIIIVMGMLLFTGPGTSACPTEQKWDGTKCVPIIITPTPEPTVTSTATPIATPIVTPITTVVPTTTPTTQINLIKNPGFDTNTYSWNLFTNGTGTFKSLNGKGVISIVNKGTNTQVYQYNFALKANTKYRLTFDAYSNTGHDMQVRIIKHISPFTQYVSLFPNLGTTSTTFTKEFTTTVAEPNARVMFWISYLGYPGDIYTIDNVKLVVV